MLIDWFTVAAQVINFLILVALLKHFLYGRIINAMDQREARITSRLEDAQNKKSEAEDEAAAYNRKSQEFDLQREEMISQAKEEAENFRKDLVLKAREEIDGMQARWHETIQKRKIAFLKELGERTTKEVFAVTRQALRDLADKDLEQQIVDVFIRRIKELDERERLLISKSIESSGKVLVTSAFQIQEEAQEKIFRAIKEHINGGGHVDYEVSPDVISGIELRTVGHKIAWSLDNYLASLETNVLEAMDMGSRSEGAE
jgi:F-type H+-transporting ATPase subunit b